LEEAFPVVLVLYDAKADKAYWLHVQKHFAKLTGFDAASCGERITVAIPRSNVLDRRAMRALARAKNAAAAIIREVWTHGV
jgi:hypothetical protein